MAALRLLAKLQDPNLTTEQLEETVSQDVALSYKLVRYVNSAIHALPNEVASIRHAIVLVGTRRISNWAGLILYGQMDDKPTELMITAIVRARMCQQLAMATKQTNVEQFFTVGLFSVLDALLDRPMPDALEMLPLAPELKAALVDHQGAMGSALLCVMAYEQGDWERAESAGIPGEAIYEAYAGALEWTRQTMKELGMEPDLKPHESIRRRSQAKLSLQQFADAQEHKIKEAEEHARKQVTRDLLARFDVEFQKLTLELEEKQRAAVAAAENASKTRSDHALLSMENAKEQLKNEFDSATKQWDIERQHLIDGKRSANDVVQSKMQEIDELEKKLSEAAQAKSALEEQMTALKSEMDQSKAAAEKQRLEAVADAEAAAEIRLQQVVVTQTRQEPERVQQQPQRTNADASAIAAEISRIVAEIDDLSQKIESPATDLAAQIRFNRERSELEAYVKGLRFSPSQDNTATS
jgi:hypothetical protein